MNARCLKRQLFAASLMIAVSACSSTSLRDASSGHFFSKAGVVVDVLDYQNRLARMNAYDYREARVVAEHRFSDTPNDENRLRLASVLLNSDGPEAPEDWRRAEQLLTQRLQDVSEPAQDEAIKIYTQNLLAQARHLLFWRARSGQCLSELDDAQLKLKELKMIEMKMMQPESAIN